MLVLLTLQVILNPRQVMDKELGKHLPFRQVKLQHTRVEAGISQEQQPCSQDHRLSQEQQPYNQDHHINQDQEQEHPHTYQGQGQLISQRPRIQAQEHQDTPSRRRRSEENDSI